MNQSKSAKQLLKQCFPGEISQKLKASITTTQKK
jgi:hypothetical protein